MVLFTIAPRQDLLAYSMLDHQLKGRRLLLLGLQEWKRSPAVNLHQYIFLPLLNHSSLRYCSMASVTQYVFR